MEAEGAGEAQAAAVPQHAHAPHAASGISAASLKADAKSCAKHFARNAAAFLKAQSVEAYSEAGAPGVMRQPGVMIVTQRPGEQQVTYRAFGAFAGELEIFAAGMCSSLEVAQTHARNLEVARRQVARADRLRTAADAPPAGPPGVTQDLKQPAPSDRMQQLVRSGGACLNSYMRAAAGDVSSWKAGFCNDGKKAGAAACRTWTVDAEGACGCPTRSCQLMRLRVQFPADLPLINFAKSSVTAGNGATFKDYATRMASSTDASIAEHFAPFKPALADYDR